MELTRFPVQVDAAASSYDWGVRPGGVACQPRLPPYWSSDTYDQFRESGFYHHAVDIMAPLGARVVAARAGHVLESWVYQGERRPGAGWAERSGWFVRIRTDDGSTDYYAHLRDEPLVVPGERVRAGQLLGYVGQTGNAQWSCPHLHFKTTDPHGTAVNPMTALADLRAAGDWQYHPRWPWLLAGAILLGTGAALYFWPR